MGMSCPIDGWQPSLTDEVCGVFLPGAWLPMHWTDSGPRPVKASDALAATWEGIAVAVHWSREHPDQLHALIGEYKLFPGMIRPHELSSTL
jgi:hypothetical protein